MKFISLIALMAVAVALPAAAQLGVGVGVGAAAQAQSSVGNVVNGAGNVAAQTTNDVNVQKQAIAGIENIMVSQLPVLPLTVNVYWDEYTTKTWTGWPDASNPYDSGAPYNMPDAENVILHLTPAS